MRYLVHPRVLAALHTLGTLGWAQVEKEDNRDFLVQFLASFADRLPSEVECEDGFDLTVPSSKP